MAEIKEVEVSVNQEILRIAQESKLIIEQFQKLLGVYTTTAALAKVAVLMREDDTASKLLSKALGHLHSCNEEGSQDLYNEIAAAFGGAVEQPLALDGAKCPRCQSVLNNDGYCLACGYPFPPRQ